MNDTASQHRVSAAAAAESSVEPRPPSPPAPPAGAPAAFDGKTFDPKLDQSRLQCQLAAVRRVMLGGGWHTLASIAEETGAPPASVSARLRDLRKTRFGGYDIQRRRVPDGDGLHEYRLSTGAAQ